MKSKQTLTIAAGFAITSVRSSSISSSTATSSVVNPISGTSPPAAATPVIRDIHDVTNNIKDSCSRIKNTSATSRTTNKEKDVKDDSTTTFYEIKTQTEKIGTGRRPAGGIQSMKWNVNDLDNLSLLRGGAESADNEQEIHIGREENVNIDNSSCNQKESLQEGDDIVQEDPMDSSMDNGGSKRKKKKKKGKKSKQTSTIESVDKNDQKKKDDDEVEGNHDNASIKKKRKGTKKSDDSNSTFQVKKDASSSSSSSSSSNPSSSSATTGASSSPSEKNPQETKFSTSEKTAANEKEHKSNHHHHHHNQKQKQNHVIEEIIQSTDLYHILSLDKSKRSSLTSAQITKAYRRRAVLTHPDKVNGDRRAFDKVSEAYDILSDETKKKIYDRFGLDAVKDPDFAARYGSSSSMSSAFSSMSGSFHDHILRNFFGGVGGGGMAFGSGATSSFGKSQPPQYARNHDVRYELEVSLEDMYRGSHSDIPITQPNGTPRTVQVDIPPGIIPGSTIRLPGMVDHVRHATPGDVIFIIRQRAHERFTRKGHDLAMEVNISLSEAINGFQREIEHLDSRKLWIQSPRDSMDVPLVIQTGDVHVLKGEGMPKRNTHRGDVSAWLDRDEEQDEEGSEEANLEERCKHFGDLYIQYVVQMPNTQQSNLQHLSLDERKTLAMLLDKLQAGVKTQQPSYHAGNDDTFHSALQDQTNTSMQNTSKPPRHLQTSKASDFGCASGIATPQRDDEDDFMYDEDDVGSAGERNSNHQHHHRSRSFHQYFTAGGPGPFFSRGSFPFTTSSSSYSGGNDEGDVQCQQM